MSAEEGSKSSGKLSENESDEAAETSRILGVVGSTEESTTTTQESTLDSIRTSLTTLLSKLSISAQHDTEAKALTVIPDLTFNGLLKHWKEHGFKRIITMVGAGISTSAGIPDFRSPGSGLYHNLQKYNLPSPTDIFELDYFMENPKPFFTLAKELYPGSFEPTPVHYFIRLLNQKNLLVRHYTQNIDCLERVAGIPEEKLVEAHGTFYTNHCLGCRKSYTKEWMKEKIFNDEIPECVDCGPSGLVKPDIVFFGENLPERFYEMPMKDFKNCDLLIIMGTSLEVYPFASLVDFVEPRCVRLLVNRTRIDKFASANNTRDVKFIGDCNDAVWQIAEALGWKDELKALIAKERADKKDEIKNNKNDKQFDDQIKKQKEDKQSDDQIKNDKDVKPSDDQIKKDKNDKKSDNESGSELKEPSPHKKENNQKL